MADVNANIDVNIDTSQALAQLKSLQRQISQFHTSISRSSEAAALAQRDLQRNFINSVNALGSFSAELRTVKTTSESFTESLEKNKFSMREYFRYAGGATKTFGRLFKSEFDTIGKVAEDRVKKLQTQYIKLGRDTSGAMKAIAIIPNELDLKNYSTQTQLAAQKQAIFNQLVKQGSTNLLNFGKNTQWAGRQLMVGFTLPLATLGVTAARTFMDMETAALKFRKVYGDLFTPSSETEAALDSITALGREFTKYGIAVSQTVGLAAEAAAAGFSGLDLQRQTTEATRLSVLGQIDQQKALETTISLQNAFKMSSIDLASSIDFLNAVENQTVVSLDDITTAIPKVAPVIQQLGGDVKDLAFFLAALKEGGVNASEGANALKSGLGALINPTEKASQMLSAMGINIKSIIETNQGDLKGTVIAFAQALDTLDPLNRARAIEQLFGKFQFARLSTLFDNVINQTGQASRVLDLAGTSVEGLAALSEKELGMTADSAMNQFRKSVEDLKAALVPVGETFLKAVTPIIEFIGGILEKFNGLSDGVKKAIVVLTVAIGAIGPVALMTFGLLANGLANIVKGAAILRNGYLRLTGQSQILGEQTDYLTTEQLNATAVAHSLDQSHANLIQTFTVEAGALSNLIGVYEAATRSAAKFAAVNPGMMNPAPKIRGYAKGGIVVVPGSGNGDTVPAMLTPGEAVIPKDMTKKYAPLIQGMIAGNIPGYQDGTSSVEGAIASQINRRDFAHVTSKVVVTLQEFLDSLNALPTAMKEARQNLITKLEEIKDAFGGDIPVNLYSGLGFQQKQSLNIGMSRGGAVSANEFLQDFQAQGIEKWKKTLQIGGVRLEDVSSELTQYDQALQDGVQRLLELNGDATITSEQFAALEREIRNTLPATSALRQALDLAENTITEYRLNLSKQMALEAGLEPYQVPSSKDPSKMSAKPWVDLESGRSIRLGGEHDISRTFEGYGQMPRTVVDDLMTEVADAAGVQSPSRRTIPMGEDIARGLQVGMMNQLDETQRVAQTLGNTATQILNPATGRPFTQQERSAMGVGGAAPQIPISNIQQQTVINEELKQSANKHKDAVNASSAALGKLNGRLMGATFAIGSVSGALSMFGADLGGLSPLLFKVNSGLFALATTLQFFTNTKFLALLSGGFGRFSRGLQATKVGQRVAQTGAAQKVGGVASRALGTGAARAGVVAAAGGVTAATGGTALIVIAALAAMAASVYMLNKAYKKQMYELERFGKAAFVSTEELSRLSEVLGVNLAKTGFQAPTVFGRTQQEQETASKFEEDIKNSEDLMNRVETLKKATGGQAAAILSSFGIQLVAGGMSPADAQILIETLAKMSEKGDVLINANIDLNTVKFKEQLEKGTNAFEGAFKSAIDELNRSTKFSDITKNIELVGGVASAAFSAVSTEVNRGTLSLEQADTAFKNITKEIKKVGKARELTVLKNALSNVSPEAAQVTRHIKSGADALALMKAGAVGVDLKPFIAQIREAGGVTDKLRDSLDTVFKGQLAVLDLTRKVSEARTKLAEMEANAIKEPANAALTEEEKLQKQLDALKRMQTKLKVSAILEVAKPAQQNFKQNVDQIISDINTELSAVDVDLQINPDAINNIFDIEKELKRIDMDVAQAVTPEYRAAQFQVDDLNQSIEQYNRKNDVANRQLGVLEERYQKQADALQEVADLQNYLSSQQKKQITLADALSQGDISAAAVAAEEMRAEAAQFRLDQEKKSLDNNPELLALREQIKLNDEEIYKINEQIYTIQQESIKPIDDALRKLERERTLLGDMKTDYDSLVAYQTESLRIKSLSNQEIEQEMELLQLQIELLSTTAAEAGDQAGKYTQAQIEAQRKLLSELEDALKAAQAQLSAEMPEEAGPMGWWRRQWERFKNFLLEDIPAFFGRLPGMIAEAAGNIWNGIKSFGSWLLDAWNATVDWFKNLPTLIATTIGKLWDGLQTFGGWIKSGWDAVVEWVKSLPSLIATTVGKLWDGIQTIGNWIKSSWDAVVEWVKNLPFLIGQTAGNLWNKLITLKDWILDKWSDIVTWLQGRPKAIGDLAIGLWDKLTSFKDWIQDKWSDVIKWLKGRPQAIAESLTDLWDKLPSIGDWLTTMGTTLIEWLRGLPALIARILNPLNLFGSIWEKFKDGWDSVTKNKTLPPDPSGINTVGGEQAAADAAREAANAAAAKAKAEKEAADKAKAEKDAKDTKEKKDLGTALSPEEIAAAAKAKADAEAQAKIEADKKAAEALAKALADAKARGTGGGGPQSVVAAAKGGLIKTNYLASGGIPKMGRIKKGTDTVPAMLTPGEFVVSKYAVQNYGVDRLKAINNGEINGDGVYNYSINVNVKSDSNPDDIARAVMTQIKRIDSQRIRGQIA